MTKDLGFDIDLQRRIGRVTAALKQTALAENDVRRAT
jgi:hypothetical protein